MTDAAPEPSPSRGLASILTDWLAVRRPTRLVVDGLMLLLVFVVLAEISRWFAWTEHNPGETSRALWFYALRLSNVFTITSSWAYYAGLVLVGVGLARIIGDAVTRSRG